MQTFSSWCPCRMLCCKLLPVSWSIRSVLTVVLAVMLTQAVEYEVLAAALLPIVALHCAQVFVIYLCRVVRPLVGSTGKLCKAGR